MLELIRHGYYSKLTIVRVKVIFMTGIIAPPTSWQYAFKDFSFLLTTLLTVLHLKRININLVVPQQSYGMREIYLKKA